MSQKNMQQQKRKAFAYTKLNVHQNLWWCREEQQSAAAVFVSNPWVYFAYLL